jgi:hypothetical protein
MFKKFLIAVGLTKAPKATIVLKSPLKGTAALLAYKGVKNADAKAKALVATVVALPVAAYVLKR